MISTYRKNKIFPIRGRVANLGHEWRIRSNIESGPGRYPDGPQITGRQGIVAEIKRLGAGETMGSQLATALEQIEERDYEAIMRAEGIGNVLRLAVVFDGKRLQVHSSAHKP